MRTQQSTRAPRFLWLLKALAVLTSVYFALSLLVALAIVLVVGVPAYLAIRAYELLTGRRVVSRS